MRWIICGEAADLVHQGCPIPISDFDKAILASGSICNFKVGKLQPQYLPTLHLNNFGSFEVGRIVTREVWRSEHTFGNESLQNFISTTHPRCHSLLLGKVSLSAARVRLQWLS